ncbi:hypothetical protein [Streptomyces sp. NPDC003077]|uniref:hypothetical protein n=1 Tax=Streptomyces sp. NPDC003077 TaxID=3154443 RepID=UPI0033AE7039
MRHRAALRTAIGATGTLLFLATGAPAAPASAAPGPAPSTEPARHSGAPYGYLEASSPTTTRCVWQQGTDDANWKLCALSGAGGRVHNNAVPGPKSHVLLYALPYFRGNQYCLPPQAVLDTLSGGVASHRWVDHC